MSNIIPKAEVSELPEEYVSNPYLDKEGMRLNDGDNEGTFEVEGESDGCILGLSDGWNETEGDSDGRLLGWREG